MASGAVPLARASREDVQAATGESAAPSPATARARSAASGPCFYSDEASSQASGPIHSPFTETNVEKVLEVRARLMQKWRTIVPPSTHPRLYGRGDFGFSVAITPTLLSEAGIDTSWSTSQQFDCRLSLFHLYVDAGLQPINLVGANNRQFYSLPNRVRYMVQRHPDCLHVPAGPRGTYFIPINPAWMQRCGERRYGFPMSLARIVHHRIRETMTRDTYSLLTGSLDVPQPSGRYYNPADWIQRWNASLGICELCGIDIYLCPKSEWSDPEWLEDNMPPPRRALATTQRTGNTTMHLASNLHDKLVCAGCNSRTNFNPNYPLGTPMGHVHQAADGAAREGWGAGEAQDEEMKPQLPSGAQPWTGPQASPIFVPLFAAAASRLSSNQPIPRDAMHPQLHAADKVHFLGYVEVVATTARHDGSLATLLRAFLRDLQPMPQYEFCGGYLGAERQQAISREFEAALSRADTEGGAEQHLVFEMWVLEALRRMQLER